MDNEKLKLLARDYIFVVDKHADYYKKVSEKKFKAAASKDDFDQAYQEILEEGLISLVETTIKWEEKPNPYSEGLAPKEFFSGLKTLDTIIEVCTAFYQEANGSLPESLTIHIKNIKDKISNDFLLRLGEIAKEKVGSLNAHQKSVLMISGIIQSEAFAAPLMDILEQFDNDSDDVDIKAVLDILADIGTPEALKYLKGKLSHYEAGSRLYSHIILAVGLVGSKNRSEETYALLKDCFRKSNTRIIEATALQFYGDGRAIPAIRGYVEKHAEEISPEYYETFRTAVIDLGGDMRDLDELFEGEDDEDE